MLSKSRGETIDWSFKLNAFFFSPFNQRSVLLPWLKCSLFSLSLFLFLCFPSARDSFYSVLREWEKYHDTPNWSMEAALGDRVRWPATDFCSCLLTGNALVSCHRYLVRQPTELCSHAHFARLFQKQLVEVGTLSKLKPIIHVCLSQFIWVGVWTISPCWITGLCAHCTVTQCRPHFSQHQT